MKKNISHFVEKNLLNKYFRDLLRILIFNMIVFQLYLLYNLSYELMSICGYPLFASLLDFFCKLTVDMTVKYTACEYHNKNTVKLN